MGSGPFATMRREPISFYTFLARILPRAGLSASERNRLERALAGDPREQERVALSTLARLIEAGVFERLPDRVDGDERVLRFQSRESHEIVALRFAAPRMPEGMAAHPRVLVALRVVATAERLRRLHRLEEALIQDDGRLTSGPAELIGLLLQTAREVLDAESAAFFPAVEPSDATGAYTPPPGEIEILRPWSGDVVLARDLLLVCADALAIPETRAAAGAARARAVASVRIQSPASGLLGVLEVRRPDPDSFTPERVSILSFLAENFSTLVDRAQRLERLVFVDPMTGAYNTAYFRQALANEVARARREGKSMALVIADIDDFKLFNTAYGYEGGNDVLRSVARLLRRTVRPFDSVARWGGEEFAVLLTSPLDREDAAMIAERLRQTVAEHDQRVTGLDQEEHRVRVTVSLGAALYPDDAESADDLWRKANQALLVAKEPPKGKVVFWSAPA